MSLIRGIFHIHTNFSGDAKLSPEKLVNFASNNHISLLGVSDHNSIKGALATKEIASKKKLNIKVIIGEEIATSDGEISGFFLQKEIPPGMSLSKTIQAIKEQNALVYLPHPFDSVRRERIKDKALILENIKDIDIIEVFNSRNMKKRDNHLAFALAEKYNKAMLWGADAHFKYELKRCIFEMPTCNLQATDFMNALKRAEVKKLQKSRLGFFHSMIKKYLPFPVF